MHKNIYVVAAKRTAIGNLMGSLAKLNASDLGASVIRELIATTGISSELIDEVVMGQVLVGGHGQNPARQTAIKAGIPYSVPAYGVSQVCGSGLKAVMNGAASIAAMNSHIVIAGGQESMSQAKHAAYLRTGMKMGSIDFVDTMQFDGITDAYSRVAMGITAENIADKYKISRELQDEFAYDSQVKAYSAQSSGRFEAEILPLKVTVAKAEQIIDKDEFIRKDIAIDALRRLKPVFKDNGSVTAGNASGINDGAAAVMLVDDIALSEYKLKPLVRIVSYAQAGVDPQFMGIAPVIAAKKAFEIAGWKAHELDLIESNEAFAAQALYVNQYGGWDPAKTNVNGGAIALGHPIGASGARVLVSLIYELLRRQNDKGLATLCIGGGMGVAMCIERC